MRALWIARALMALGLAAIVVFAGLCVYLREAGDDLGAFVTGAGVFVGGLLVFLGRIEAREARARLRR